METTQNMVSKGKVAIWILSIALIVSILANGLLFIMVGGMSIINEEQIALNDIQWCEISNEWKNIVNDLIYELEYYDSSYVYDDLYVEPTDCWGI